MTDIEALKEKQAKIDAYLALSKTEQWGQEVMVTHEDFAALLRVVLRISDNDGPTWSSLA